MRQPFSFAGERGCLKRIVASFRRQPKEGGHSCPLFDFPKLDACNGGLENPPSCDGTVDAHDGMHERAAKKLWNWAVLNKADLILTFETVSLSWIIKKIQHQHYQTSFLPFH
jgi:hypothetical protein